MTGRAPLPNGLVDCTNAVYHGGPGESKSRLDAMEQGARVYWNNYENPVRPERKASPALLLGSATHSAILEPDQFPIEFVVMPEFNLRKKDEKAERDAFVADCEATGRTAVSPAHYDLALAMRDAVHTHPVAGPLMRRLARAGAKSEQSYFAIDPTTGLLIKCRFDYVLPSEGYSLDLKTTRGAAPDSFGKSAADYRYVHQEAWYRHVYQQATEGETLRDWVFLAVESTPPFQVGLYSLPRDIVVAAQSQNMDTLRQIADCKAMDHWPDPAYAGIQELALPTWAVHRLPIDSPETDFPEEL